LRAFQKQFRNVCFRHFDVEVPMSQPHAQSEKLVPDHKQRRRGLSHHVPLAIASAGLLVMFVTVPGFNVNAYEHGDITTGKLPQRSTASSSTNSSMHTHVRPDRATSGRPSRHGAGHEMGASVPAPESGTLTHGDQGTEESGHRHAFTHSDGKPDLSLSRNVQQLTVATGYLGVALLAVTLLLGPANLVLARRNPVSSYLRRDAGIWTGVFSVVHVILAAAMHVSHGSGVVASVLHFFVAEDGRPLTNSFGLGNWTGAAALVIVFALLATSSDAALRALRAKPWKWIQRLTYVLFALVMLHAFFYGALLRMTSPFTLLLILSVSAVLAGQVVGIWLWRRRYARGAA
jgi:methionine sulfoxide reductase heme-binding subunit